MIECKDRQASIDDTDWLDAQDQGRRKAKKQGLKAFFVTNTDTETRCYNRYDLSEVTLDGEVISDLQPIPILRAINTQVGSKNSDVFYSTFTTTAPNPRQFRTSLWNLRQSFRACGISKGSEELMIETTLTLCILKLISEQQQRLRTIPETILLWEDWRKGRMKKEMQDAVDELVQLPPYSHLKDALGITSQLDSRTVADMHREISQYSLFDTDFDFFGLVYESFANTQMKRDFGEFYTPRHIIRVMVKLLLSDEKKPRSMMICDPACGTGGFLVESLLFLKRQYSATNTLTDDIWDSLRNSTFYGHDTNLSTAIRFARVNMMMAGNSGVNIKHTKDSLIHLEEDTYDYVLANIPYGAYAGKADISTFSYTNKRRFELLFIEKIIRSLRLGGRAAVIVPDGLVETSDYEGFRKSLLRDVRMDAVVSLPDFAFEPYTSEKTYVLFFTRKRPSQSGKFQKEPIWHFVVDNDGFQTGKKRYEISENDLPDLEEGFMTLEESGKAGFIPISDVNQDTFYSLASEAYLRRTLILELSPKTFKIILDKTRALLGRKRAGE